MTEELADGWYLMSTGDLERELARWRAPEEGVESSNAVRLDTDDALRFRNSGNIPDELGRSLRLVLHVEDTHALASLAERRLRFEPDYQDAPTWRREGSRPVNVVPLRRPNVSPASEEAWWEDAELAELELEFTEHGTVAGVRVPGEHRGFIFKTVLALRAQGAEITPTAITNSIARWLPEEIVASIARELSELNDG